MLLGVLIAASCAPRKEASSNAGAQTDTATAPRLTRLRPDTLRIRDGGPNVLVLEGTGFDATQNIVVVGPVRLANVPSSAAGTRIEIYVPDRVVSAGGAPPALWERGRVLATVVTSRGQSSALPLEIVP